ncbi:class I SAM-dependent methyltransferase [Haloarchaeobius sp. HRN-SO-5]|uniref:class I SAM-dependent methyltransferase n=1 Tax=Haloarchaeobius sp. HRN-SO-5 TaxID=3446118 RepID=UPI003EB9460F
MPKTAPFESFTDRYEHWFEEFDAAYQSELEALRRIVPTPGYGVEIGVGSARFAAPLGFQVGLDPAAAMLERAQDRGVEVVRGVAEHLPFQDGRFDTALVVTTICFVDDVPRTLTEARRVVGPSGRLVIGYIDADSPVGRTYREQKEENPFYRDAVFVSTDELVDQLEAAGFGDFEFVQTIYRQPDEITALDRIESGYGDGSFVGIAATAR